jgi:NAD-dependent SIR2 family protein deacetylase
MRFFADGPDIPDDLLNARDEGRVVFFCGSGVSRATAGLPDFLGLAEKVIERLGSSASSPANKVLSAIKQSQPGLEASISADRIFGLLEREFLTKDIQAAVAGILKPQQDIDLSPHKILLNLATNNGVVKIVTTNFDRIFEQCAPSIPTHSSPRLPDLDKKEEINGIVYLHGMCDTNYLGSEGDSFVLSSSEFGNAYLAEGWATKFYKEIIKKYVVVFIGYSADDPPVSYLLEAINKSSGQFKHVFAFQPGSKAEAIGKWEHKGIQAISYNTPKQSHHLLWDTLGEWAKRAANPDAWRESVISRSIAGPAKLLPFERGQVAHVVSTVDGARAFANSSVLPPATWLCTFDRTIRLADKGRSGSITSRKIFVPIDNFGLDSDAEPLKRLRVNNDSNLDMLSSHWDCFELNEGDLKDSLTQSLNTSLRVDGVELIKPLTPRVKELVNWIGKVSDQPCSVWWASRRKSLHTYLIERINLNVSNKKDSQSKLLGTAWRYLFESIEEDEYYNWSDVFNLKNIIENQGWNSSVTRAFIKLHKPSIEASPNVLMGNKPPEDTVESIHSLFSLRVKYPQFIQDNLIDVPIDFLAPVVAGLKTNLEIAITLEEEVSNGYRLNSISPINNPPSNRGREHLHSRDGLSGYVIHFSKLFARLSEKFPALAIKEFERWPKDDNPIFNKLRVWSLGLPNFLTEEVFVSSIIQENENAFWSWANQRDLLYTLKARWNGLSEPNKLLIEARLKAGLQTQRDDETKKEFSERSLTLTLDRLNWLHREGCVLTFKIEEFNQESRLTLPNWDERSDTDIVGPGARLVGFVKQEKKYDELMEIPFSEILNKSVEIYNRKQDIFKNEDPFAGLCEYKPFRAYKALTLAAMNGEFPEWAWERFLSIQETSLASHARLNHQLAQKLLDYDVEKLLPIRHRVVGWFGKASNFFVEQYPELVTNLFEKFLKLIELNGSNSDSEITRNETEVNWYLEAINSPVGVLAKGLINSPLLKDLKAKSGLPNEWKIQAENLLQKPEDLGRYVISVFSHDASWLYSIDPSWFKANVLKELDPSNEENVAAFWSGFLESTWSVLPTIEIFVVLKSSILAFATSSNDELFRKSDYERLAWLLLGMWISRESPASERVLTTAEFREIILNSHAEVIAYILQYLSELNVEEYQNELPIFFKEVWPLQKALRTSDNSAKLFDLAWQCQNNFAEMVNLIEPFISTINGRVQLSIYTRDEDNLFSRHPEESLRLLYAALSESPTMWLYGIENALEKIEGADQKLASDPRFIKLKRVWSQRNI